MPKVRQEGIRKKRARGKRELEQDSTSGRKRRMSTVFAFLLGMMLGGTVGFLVAAVLAADGEE